MRAEVTAGTGPQVAAKRHFGRATLAGTAWRIRHAGPPASASPDGSLNVSNSDCYNMGMATTQPSLPVAKDLPPGPPKVKRRGDRLALEVSPEQGRRLTGSADLDFAERLASSVAAATPGQGSDLAAVNAGLAPVSGIRPRDELEGMMAAQMAAVHSLAMEMSKRALIP